MPASAVQNKPSDTTSPVANDKAKLITWEEFQRRYLSREDDYKYEWADGIVIKTKRTMDFHQFFILQNLDFLFEKLRSEKNITGMLIQEGDIFFGTIHRRPDVCYLSADQIARTAHGKNEVPKFVIEIISTHDQMNLVEDKMEDYEAAGVEVVWQIFPKQQLVKVYRGKNAIKCKGEDICDAAPVLPDFAMTAGAVFKKPELPVTD